MESERDTRRDVDRSLNKGQEHKVSQNSRERLERDLFNVRLSSGLYASCNKILFAEREEMVKRRNSQECRQTDRQQRTAW
jgi:hypothetical protein